MTAIVSVLSKKSFIFVYIKTSNMDIILIRHTSVDVPKGTCYGATDVPLADTFEQEAAATKRNLAQYGDFDAVFSSPLTRARKLAEYCGYRSPRIDDRIKEMNMGDWEMRKFDDIKDKELQEWYDDYMHKSTKNGESFPLLYARVASFIDEMRTKDYRRIAVFAHGGVLMCAGIYGGLYPESECFKHLVPYGGIMKISV